MTFTRALILTNVNLVAPACNRFDELKVKKCATVKNVSHGRIGSVHSLLEMREGTGSPRDFSLT